MTSRIIHSGLLLDFLKACTTFSRLACFWRFWTDCSVRILSRSSTARSSMATRRSSSLMASAPIWARNALGPYSSRALRNCSSVRISFGLSSVPPGSMTQ